MTEHKVGNTVVLTGTIVEIEGDVALVAVDRSFPAGGTIAVRLGKLPAASYDAVHGHQRTRLLSTMAEAQDHPGRAVTR